MPELRLPPKEEPFHGWVILELMGHRRLVGWLQERTIAGASFLQLNAPTKDGNVVTQIYSASAVYCITPTTQDVVEAMAGRNEPEPIRPYELPRMLPAVSEADDDHLEEPEDWQEDGKPF